MRKKYGNVREVKALQQNPLGNSWAKTEINVVSIINSTCSPEVMMCLHCDLDDYMRATIENSSVSHRYSYSIEQKITIVMAIQNGNNEAARLLGSMTLDRKFIELGKCQMMHKGLLNVDPKTKRVQFENTKIECKPDRDNSNKTCAIVLLLDPFHKCPDSTREDNAKMFPVKVDTSPCQNQTQQPDDKCKAVPDYGQNGNIIIQLKHTGCLQSVNYIYRTQSYADQEGL